MLPRSLAPSLGAEVSSDVLVSLLDASSSEAELVAALTSALGPQARQSRAPVWQIAQSRVR